MENRTLTLTTDATLTITRRSDLKIDIAKLADIFEEWMIDNLDDILAVGLDLKDDDIDYIMDDNKLMNTVLALAKAEMFARTTEKKEEAGVKIGMKKR